MGYDVPMERNSIPRTETVTPKILKTYNQLNTLGKQEAEKRVQELTYIPKYTTPDYCIEVTDEIMNIKKENDYDERRKL